MAKASRIALIANGELGDNETLLEKIRSCDYLIAVDGGVNHCHKLGLRPDIIIGDFDSASPEFLLFFPDVPQKKYPKDKDKTDLELAIEHALEKEAKNLTIFGGCGKRIDHTLSNINLLSRYPGILFLETERELLFVIDRQAVLKCKKGQTISLIPLNGPVSGITTRGLKWELNNGKLDKNFLGISNVCLADEIKISVGHGDLLCVLVEAMGEPR
ncbi:MAG TPA: thiamine diphosphokinase [Rhabdochlamydiaceae bacterium]|nr:thiamine diphosphokinase [Rhabdochlamydiaceae bacterium]